MHYMARVYVPPRPSLYAETPEALEGALAQAGFEHFRVKQLLQWLYAKRVDTFEAMHNLPAPLRLWLGEHYTIAPCEPVHVQRAGDVTEKWLLRLGDGQLIETVLIRAPQAGVGQEQARKTVCISTQVGCAYGCKFCASGLNGWKRDLLASEIVGQLMHFCRLEAELGSQRRDGIPFDNIVVMGMGEPLANYDALMKALSAVHAEWGLGFGARRITVSTSGLAPQIRRLAEESFPFRLAISLHGASNEVRNRIMPVNKRYPLEDLLPAARLFSEKHGHMLTLEYILISGINDMPEEAERLAKIASNLHAHVNLIPYNTVEGLPWERPLVPAQERFCENVRKRGVSVTLRREKGHDIAAACGQLKLKKEEALGHGS